jgi:hypothetical protein
MPRLKDRQHFPPSGFRFYQAESQWNAPEHVSFDAVVQALIAHRKGNPALAQKYPTDYNTVADQVDEYTAAVCKSMGWTQWLTEGGGDSALPFSPVPVTNLDALSAAARNIKTIWAGVKTLDEWIDSGSPAVEPSLAETRAANCATCPENAQGDWTAWFTKPASEAIRRQLEKVQNRNLTTSRDDALKVCSVCWCPLRLKIWLPIANINAHLSNETRTALQTVTNPSGGCWQVKEP